MLERSRVDEFPLLLPLPLPLPGRVELGLGVDSSARVGRVEDELEEWCSDGGREGTKRSSWRVS